jgi:exodeoxyribonuclease VII large subunit
LQDLHNNAIPRKVYSVSQLTDQIKALLEDRYSMVWISGEISNLRIPPSGHAYFTLKDQKSQISAVMFRGQLRQLKFDIEDGLVLVALGRLTVYPPRGNYQIILEYIEPHGAGALQIAFEQLKRKLSDEGLFSEDHKAALPFLPRRIGIITSPTGAVIQDIVRVLSRRFYNVIIDIYPVRVQGVQSPAEIIHAIELANRLKRNDLLILARGGGSLEDLSPFNDEGVARSIFASRIPVVSAVGHETDFTIADFVADARAPTPSAAAEIIVPVKHDMQSRIAELRLRCARAMQHTCDRMRQRLVQNKRLIVHPGKRVEDMRLHVDQLGDRLRRSLTDLVQDRKNRLDRVSGALGGNSPIHGLGIYRSKVELLTLKATQILNIYIGKMAERYKRAHALLGAVNPSAILNRGYSITRTLPDRRVVMDAGDLTAGQLLEVQLAHGKVDVSVLASNKDIPNHQPED